MTKTSFFATLVLSCVPIVALAQDTPFTSESGSRPMLHPDGTYFFNHAPGSDLVFEAQIAPRIIIMDSIADASGRLLQSGRKPVWGWQASATPLVKLRMFREASSPVRTPSYMPKGTLQVVRMRNLSTADPVDEAQFDRGPVEMWLLDVIPFGHHSNGQNGCLITSQVRDAGGECVDRVPAAAKAINKNDGSFSTNYVQAMLQYGRMYLDADGAPEGDFATRWEWRVGAGVQLNPQNPIGGSIDPELSDIYGPTRVLAEATSARRGIGMCGRLEGDLALQYIVDAPSGVPGLTTRAEASCLPRKWGGAGIFVRFFRGQDYYNLGFFESISRLQFGVTLQRGSFLSFHP